MNNESNEIEFPINAERNQKKVTELKKLVTGHHKV